MLKRKKYDTFDLSDDELKIRFHELRKQNEFIDEQIRLHEIRKEKWKIVGIITFRVLVYIAALISYSYFKEGRNLSGQTAYVINALKPFIAVIIGILLIRILYYDGRRRPEMQGVLILVIFYVGILIVVEYSNFFSETWYNPNNFNYQKVIVSAAIFGLLLGHFNLLIDMEEIYVKINKLEEQLEESGRVADERKKQADEAITELNALRKQLEESEADEEWVLYMTNSLNEIEYFVYHNNKDGESMTTDNINNASGYPNEVSAKKSASRLPHYEFKPLKKQTPQPESNS